MNCKHYPQYVFLASLFCFLMMAVPAQGQVIWQENFSGANQGWTQNFTDCDGTVASFAGVRNNRFEIQDMEGAPCCAAGGGNGNDWTTSAIDISSACAVSISISFGFTGTFECNAGGPFFGCGGGVAVTNGHDQMLLEYNLDNTGWVLFSYVCGGQSGIANATGLNGSTLQIRVRAANKAAAELYFFDNVIVDTELANPTAGITPSGPTTFCGNQSVTLTGTGGSVYSWSNGVNANAITVNTSGTFTVTATDGNGCTGSASVVVNALTQPTVTMGSNSPVCAGQSLQLQASSASNGTFVWTGPGGYTATGRFPDRDNATPAHSGTYQVTLTATNGCTVSGTVNATVNACPEICANGIDDDNDGLVDTADADCSCD